MRVLRAENRRIPARVHGGLRCGCRRRRLPVGRNSCYPAPVKRTASAVWFGAVRTGDGSIMSHSGALDRVPYVYASRFSANPGTSPEELLAAAHASCFTLTLCTALSQAGLAPTRISTQALVNFTETAGTWSISAVHLEVRAAVADVDAAEFAELALGAKNSSPITRALQVPVTLDAKLDLDRVDAVATPYAEGPTAADPPP
jgi:lipoyl-dependent peroxiredoxin